MTAVSLKCAVIGKSPMRRNPMDRNKEWLCAKR
jgi:hypothetical protein